MGSRLEGSSSPSSIVNETTTPNTSGDSKVIIKLVGDKPLIWTAEEWLKLQQHRLIGRLIGVPAHFPRQINENGLPMLLIPEEVSLILEKNLGKICRYKKTSDFSYGKYKKDYEDYLTNNKEEQSMSFKDMCRKQVIDKLDVIIEGKKRKFRDRQLADKVSISEPEIDKDALIESEVERRLTAATSTYLIQIPTGSSFIKEENLEPVDWKYPETPKEKIKYQVFKDLYDKGYSITPGSKFGGDFLVYPGEPWKFHAYFIIKCLEFNEELRCNELIRHARVGVSTRKNLVIASIDDDSNITYNTFSWPGKA